MRMSLGDLEIALRKNTSKYVLTGFFTLCVYVATRKIVSSESKGRSLDKVWHYTNKEFKKGGTIMKQLIRLLAALALVLMLRATASAATFVFSTGAADGRLGAASRPESHGKIEIQAGDDFVLTSRTVLHQATFTGLLFHGG